MASQRLLINGVLLEVTLQPETTVTVATRCGIHLVNLGVPLFCVSRYRGPGPSSEGFGLGFGGVAKIGRSTEDEVVQDESKGAEVIDLVFSLLEPTLNFTEACFSKQVKDVLLQSEKFRKQDQKASNSQSDKNIKEIEDQHRQIVRGTLSSANGCGALEISGVARESCAETRCPQHAAEMIAAMAEVNAFEGQNGEKMCVGKKRSKPRHVWMCPRLDGPTRIDAIARRAAIGEAMWRQCGASFSTMMRHFQKSPTMFRWEADSERRTIITKS